MTLDDIPQVVTIDRVSFNPSWSPQSYAYEIEQSTYSHMVVLEDSALQTRIVKRRTWWQRLLAYFNGHQNGTQIRRQIVGYGGLWNIMDEAHISTIAVHPQWRGSGYGEVLLAGMIQRAITLEASYIVLEVRVSNVTAQNLYRKYDFEIVGTKTNYYRNNNEDAYDMRLTLTARGGRGRFYQRLEAMKARCPFVDLYTEQLKV
jgi:ribosomal-protein-alanine N-acetyltransferase